MSELFKLIMAIPRGLAAFILGVGNFLSRQWSQYTPLGQLLWALALLCIAVDAGISYEYGVSISKLHAAGFALVAIAFCVLPDVAVTERRKGNKAASGWIFAVCVPLGLVAYQTHVGYGASIRVGDFQQTAIHNAKFETKGDAAKEAQEKIKTLQLRRDILNQELDVLVSTKLNGWDVAFRPSSSSELDGLISAKQLERDNEAKRGGCKRECEKRQNQLGHLQTLKAKAIEIERNEQQYQAAEKGLENARKVVDDATYQSSAAVNQTNVFAKLANLWKVGFTNEALDVSPAQQEITNTALMGLVSLAFLLLAPILNLAAGLNRVSSAPEYRSYTAPNLALRTHVGQGGVTPAAKVAEAIAPPSQHTHTHTREIIDDRTAVKKVLETLRDGLRAPIPA